MSPRKKKEDNSGVTPLDQINSYLEQNKGDHYNFEEERTYTVSSGSLLLDIEMGGIIPYRDYIILLLDWLTLRLLVIQAEVSLT